MDKKINSFKNDFIETRPQRLCRKCGNCCRFFTTAIPYEELKILAKHGDKLSMDFLNFFEPYESIEEARKLNKKVVDNIINALKNNNDFDEKKLTFYKCKYLSEDNLCKIYETRKDSCIHFPMSPWVIAPIDCGFEGWMFLKREEIKQKVRKEKEALLDAQISLSKAKTSEQIKKIKTSIRSIKNSINRYSKYGSDDW